MKTLAVSLHRLGDLIMHAHVLRSLHLNNGDPIDILAHPFINQIKFLFPFIERFFIFERSLCQKSIGEYTYNKTWAFRHIQKILYNLNKNEYNHAIDLSQTETSSRWMSYIQSELKTGVSYNQFYNKKIFCSNNNWIRYLHENEKSQFHFIDVFKKSLDLPLTALPEISNECANSNLILMQTLTSDRKKNWTTASWKSLIHRILNEYPQFEIAILASDEEYPQLKIEFSSLLDSIKILSTNMEESFQLIKESRLLITLDTAMKHLATWTGVPIIEIALGSSNPYETGAYQNGAMILKSNVSCAPCRHSSECPQRTFLCQDDLSVEEVMEAVRIQIQIQEEIKMKLLTKKVECQRLLRSDLLKKITFEHKNKELLKSIYYVEAKDGNWWNHHSLIEL